MVVNPTRRWTGILLIAISAAGFGTLAIFGRMAYADGMDAFTIGFLRFGLSGALMSALLIARREAWPRGRTLLALAGMGGAGYVIQSSAYLIALQYASAGLVALLLYLYPAMVAGLSAVFLRERLSPRKLTALALATLGAALTAGPAGGQIIGALLAALAAATYSIYILVGARVLRQVTPLQSSVVIFLAAGLVFGLVALARGPHWPVSLAGWSAISAIVLLATILPVLTFLAGLERIGPTNAAMLSTLEPVVTVILAAIFLHENQPPLALLGGGLILAAVAVLARAH